MGSVFAHDIGLEPNGIAIFMSATMLGTVVLQWPLGWLSDQVDRRQIIIWTAAGAAATSFALTTQVDGSLYYLLPFAFIFGALSLPAYSLCVSHVNDHVEKEALVATASGLILVYGAGSAPGPFAASLVMSQLGPAGLYICAGIVELLFVVFGFYRLTLRSAVLKELKQVFVSLPRTTHVAMQLDKRG